MHILTAILAQLFIQTVHAQNIWAKYAAPMGGLGSGRMFVNEFSVRIANFFLLLFTGGCVLAIMYGAFGMITSFGGDEGKEKAKKTLIAATIGLVLAFTAQMLLKFATDLVKGIVN